LDELLVNKNEWKTPHSVPEISHTAFTTCLHSSSMHGMHTSRVT